MAATVPFPYAHPPGYVWFEDEPAFDPVRHLDLASPEESLDLVDLGYRPEVAATKATSFAVSGPFRILSDEGAAIMLTVARRLREHSRAAGDRIEFCTRGGCYRSRWLRDLCTSPELTAHLSAVFGTEVAPHPMPLHLGHLNYEPTDVAATVDKWHHDTLALDFVMMVTDPATVDGGRFEWFHGTKDEAAELAAAGATPPADRVVAPEIPGPGWAVALHGDMVVHRGAALNELSERITMVNGYVATDPTRDAQSRSEDLIAVDDPALLYTEWARFAAWRSAGRLEALITNLEFGLSPDDAADALEAAIDDARQAAQLMRAGEPERIHHYEHPGADSTDAGED